VIASFRSTMNKVARGKGKHLHYRLKIELKGTFILACGDLQLHWRSPILPYYHDYTRKIFPHAELRCVCWNDSLGKS